MGPVPITSWNPLRFGTAVALQNQPHERDHWLAIRQDGLGGSDIAGVLGEYEGEPWEDSFSIWCAKCTPGAVPDDETFEMRLGRYLEAFMADEYQRRYGPVELVIGLPTLRHVDEDWRRASLDAIVVSADRRFVLELIDWKRVFGSAADHWRDGTAPINYQHQLRWYESVTGVHRSAFGAMIGNRIRRVPLKPDAAERDRILTAARAFWVDHVVPRRPPRPGPSSKTRAILRRRAPEPVKQRRRQRMPVASPDEAALIERIAEIRAQRAALQREMDAAQNQLDALLGPREGVQAPTGRKAQRKMRRGRVDYARLVEDLEVPVSVLESYRADPEPNISVR